MSSEKIDTRTKILNAAWALLEAGEPSAVRMSDVAKRAGLSRQAVYAHFPSRAELLIAVTRHIDAVKDVDAMLAASRAAENGVARLSAYVEAWGGYMPEVYGVAKALIAMRETDEAAREAWADRLAAIRHGCAAAVEALERDGALSPRWTEEEATDLLCTLLSIRNWEEFTKDCGWSQQEYVERMKSITARILLSDDALAT